MNPILRKVFKADAEEMAKTLSYSSDARLILIAVLNHMLKERKSVSLSDPNWQIKRAYNDGQADVISVLKKMLDKSEEEND